MLVDWPEIQCDYVLTIKFKQVKNQWPVYTVGKQLLAKAKLGLFRLKLETSNPTNDIIKNTINKGKVI